MSSWKDYYDNVHDYADRLTSIHGLEGFAVYNIEEDPNANLKFKKALIFWWGSYDNERMKRDANK